MTEHAATVATSAVPVPVKDGVTVVSGTSTLKTNFAPKAAEGIPSPEFVRREGGDTVTMLFPRRVILNLDNHKRIEFYAGPQEVPVALSDHWYLKQNGVTMYAPRTVGSGPHLPGGAPVSSDQTKPEPARRRKRA
jgi:hypothetical protein